MRWVICAFTECLHTRIWQDQTCSPRGISIGTLHFNRRLQIGEHHTNLITGLGDSRCEYDPHIAQPGLSAPRGRWRLCGHPVRPINKANPSGQLLCHPRHNASQSDEQEFERGEAAANRRVQREIVVEGKEISCALLVLPDALHEEQEQAETQNDECADAGPGD